MITTIVVTIFSAANVCIAYDKMYQATTFSIAVLCVSVLVPQLYIISVALRWTAFFSYTKLQRLLTLKLDRSEISSEVSVLIQRNEENAQPLYDRVSLNRE